jgi:hypothetical protein
MSQRKRHASIRKQHFAEGYIVHIEAKFTMQVMLTRR